MIAALLKEIDLFTAQGPELTGINTADPIETIYFGGGTPSLCSGEEIKSILDKLRSSFTLAADAEITLEANPDDMTAGKLSDPVATGWLEAGINRLSIGIQSFYEEDLRWMNRAHTAQQAIDSLQLAARQFPNITIDLIYGTPALTNEKWKTNVQKAIDLGIPHLSCYALTVEPQTALDKMIRLHQSPAIDPDKQSEQFLLLMQWLEEAGYEHYEISNFAKPGWRSRHNSSYWKGVPYTGFGPSAHSYNGTSRWWNVSNNNKYIQQISQGIIPSEQELLTPAQQLNEYIMTSLRTAEGLDMEWVSRAVGVRWLPGRHPMAIGPDNIVTELMRKSRKYIGQGLMEEKGQYLILTKQGKLLADGIAADLFTDQE